MRDVGIVGGRLNALAAAVLAGGGIRDREMFKPSLEVEIERDMLAMAFNAALTVAERPRLGRHFTTNPLKGLEFVETRVVLHRRRAGRGKPDTLAPVNVSRYTHRKIGRQYGGPNKTQARRRMEALNAST